MTTIFTRKSIKENVDKNIYFSWMTFKNILTSSWVFPEECIWKKKSKVVWNCMSVSRQHIFPQCMLWPKFAFFFFGNLYNFVEDLPNEIYRLYNSLKSDLIFAYIEICEIWIVSNFIPDFKRVAFIQNSDPFCKSKWVDIVHIILNLQIRF